MSSTKQKKQSLTALEKYIAGAMVGAQWLATIERSGGIPSGRLIGPALDGWAKHIATTYKNDEGEAINFAAARRALAAATKG